MKSDVDQAQGLDEVKVKRLKYNILRVEHENLRTREHSNDEMIDIIRRLIEEEVKKCY